jgi:aminoglycoside phosphotransferase (APT) family kinase protein
MDELAALHAAYWGRDLSFLGTTTLTAGDGAESEQRMAAGAAILQYAVDQFRDELPSEFARLGQLYVQQHRAVGALFNEGEKTLIHGDDHSGNLFVDDGRTGFYDWAVAAEFPGMRDVAYFLCNSLPTEARRRTEEALIARYREGLAARGVTLSADLAHEQYRLFSVYSWISATTTAGMGDRWQPIEVGRRAMQRTTQAVIDLDVLGLLGERLR